MTSLYYKGRVIKSNIGFARDYTMSNGVVKSGIYSSSFAEVFRTLLAETNVSCYQIAEYSHIDEGYLSRLRTGEKHNPSPETIMKIALALAHLSKEITLHELEKLFSSVGRSLRTKN